MKKNYRDFYGGTASISVNRDGSAKLVVRDGYGRKLISKEYATERGAKIAMGKCSDCWRETK